MADTLNIQKGTLETTSMRIHDMALQRWLNQTFHVAEGYPVPCLFASMMDAFGAYVNLWKSDHNPYTYLFNLKDANGTPLYLPYPTPPILPLISISHKGWKYRPGQNFSLHRYRNINWPTVSRDVDKCQLANVTTSRMPMAWDHNYEITFYANRPDTVSFFVDKLYWAFSLTGGKPQNWLLVDYPGWGQKLVRFFPSNDPQWTTPEEKGGEEAQRYQVTVPITLEGFSPDLDFQIFPALWKIVFAGPTVPGAYTFKQEKELAEATAQPRVSLDLRPGKDTILDSRPNIPPEGEACKLSSTLSPRTLGIEFSADTSIKSEEVFGTPVLTVA